MFGNSKEYQDIQKLYEEKVSKSEQVDEGFKDFIDQGGVAGAINRSMKKNEPIKKIRKAISNIEVGSSTDNKKFKPFKNIASKKPIGANKDTSSEIESSEAEFKANEGGKFNQRFKDANTDTSSEIESSEQSAKVEAKPKRRPVPSPSEAGMGPGAAKARAMAKARIAAKKANPNQKQLSGRERAQAMAKARIAAKKKAAMSEGLDDAKELVMKGVKKSVKAVANKAGSVGKVVKNTAVKVAKEVKKGYDAQEEYTPYDIVLEYLLSSQQAATIEEANYIMTEMDAKTIQDIVSQQLNEQN